MRSLPLFGLGTFFALGGIALFAFTLRKATQSVAAAGAAPLKKSQVRQLEAQKTVQKTETKKLRIAGAICVAVGAALMALS